MNRLLRNFILFLLIAPLVQEGRASASEPYELKGKDLFIVNLNQKSCLSIQFSERGTFTRGGAKTITGNYSYRGGKLSMLEDSDGAVLDHLQYQSHQEESGKLAITMKRLGAADTVVLFVNERFCTSASLEVQKPLITSKHNSMTAENRHKNAGWTYSYTKIISGDDVSMVVSFECEETKESSYEAWLKKAKSVKRIGQACAGSMKDSKGNYFTNTYGCNSAVDPNGRQISIARAIRMQGSKVTMTLERWYSEKSQCEDDRKNEKNN